MGKIYKNGVQYTNDANTLSTELTWEEYSQLTDAEKMNGMYYYITNVDPFVESVAPHGFTPIGTIISVMGKTAPKNYLACDGTAYNISEFPELAHYFAEQFGSNNYFGGDGTTTFAVPDLQGEFLRGAGTNSHIHSNGVLEGSGGAVGNHQSSTHIPTVAFDTAGAIYTPSYDTNFYGSFGNADASINGNAGKGRSATMGTAWNSSGATLITVRPTNTSVLYCIASRNIYLKPENDYSTDEKVVGTWIDGKPIYQKTIDCGALPNNTYKDIPSGLSDITIINMYGMSKATNDGAMIPIPRTNNGSANTDVDISYRNDNKIRLISQMNLSAFDWTYVTLQYIKTTD